MLKYEIVDNEYNRKWYPKFIGKLLDDMPYNMYDKAGIYPMLKAIIPCQS